MKRTLNFQPATVDSITLLFTYRTVTSHPHIPFTHRRWFWDTLIGAALCTCLVFIVNGLVRNESGTLSTILTYISAAGFILIFYGSFIEPKRLTLNKKIIRNSTLPSCTIAIASDFHLGPYNNHRLLEKIVRKISKLQPDVIVLPGDFIENFESSIDELFPLKKLPTIAPTYAVVGNHDAGCLKHPDGTPLTLPDRTEEIKEMLTSMKIRVLSNEHDIVSVNNEEFTIAGIDDLFMESADVKKTMDGCPKDLPIVLLSHNPDALLHAESAGATLIISGHTHGGQIRLPFIGALAPMPNDLGRKYDHGVFTVHNEKTILAISHGVGEASVRARLFCPPEILLLEIHNKE